MQYKSPMINPYTKLNEEERNFLYFLLKDKNNIRDVGSTADLVLVLLVHLVHWYLVHGLIGTSGALVPGTLVPTVT